MVVAKCGTAKILISLGAAHVHSEGSPFIALAMVPPHLVEKWAREAFLTLPGVRVFLIDDLRNGGDQNKSQGVNEVRIRRGHIVREGSKRVSANCDYDGHRRVPGNAGCRCVGDRHFLSSDANGRSWAISGGTRIGYRVRDDIWDVW
jgi:hypothetical protein